MVRGQRKLKATLVESSKTVSNVTNFSKQLTMIVQPVTITSYFSADVNIENNYLQREENHTPMQPCVRISPRKHASTLSVLQQTNNNNITPKKSPHKIEINYDETIEDVNVPDKFPETPCINPQPPIKLQKVDCQKTDIHLNHSESKTEVLFKEKKANHKLTDFFPVRRSVRKTKRVVQEEMQKNMENAVLTKREEGLKVEVFKEKGRGVIATRKFDRGEFVVEYAGDLITFEEAKEREAIYSQDLNTGCYMYYFTFRSTQYCVDATLESNRLGRLVNHSRNGNLLTKIIVVNNKPHLVLIAKEIISEGEELTYDYGDRSKESLRYHPWLAY